MLVQTQGLLVVLSFILLGRLAGQIYGFLKKKKEGRISLSKDKVNRTKEYIITIRTNESPLKLWHCTHTTLSEQESHDETLTHRYVRIYTYRVVEHQYEIHKSALQYFMMTPTGCST